MVSCSSGSESRDRIRRADLLRKRVPSRRGRVCERPLAIRYCTDRWMTEDVSITAVVAEWLEAWDTLTMFEATVCGRS